MSSFVFLCLRFDGFLAVMTVEKNVRSVQFLQKKPLMLNCEGPTPLMLKNSHAADGNIWT